MKHRYATVLALSALTALALSGCTGQAEPEPTPSQTVDPRAVSAEFDLTSDGYVSPGSGVTVGTTVPTFFLDSSGEWDISLTVDSITKGDPADLSVIQDASGDLTGLVPYYTTITATLTGGEGDISGKSIGTLFTYVTEGGASAPRLVSINGAFPACEGSDAFPAQPAAETPEAEAAKTITFCQVSLSSDTDPVDQVNWQPQDTPYSADDGKPVFFRPAK